MLSILTQFLPNRSQHVMVNSCRSSLVNVVSGVPQSSVLDPLLFFLYTSEFFSILENKLIGYADDSTLIAVVTSPGVRVTVAESLSSDFVKVSEWCDLWETIIVSRSRTMHPQSPGLTIGGTVLKESDAATSQRLGILRKSWQVFHDRLLLGRCFRGFVLPVLEYCSAVWCSAADTHLKLQDRVVSGDSFLTGVFECDLSHRRSVVVLCTLYKFRCNPMHPPYDALLDPSVPIRVTGGV